MSTSAENAIATIAHCSLRKAVLPMGGLLAIICLLIVEAINAGRIALHGQFWLVYMAIGWACGIVLLLLILAFLRQFFFYERRAIWVEDGNIIYLDKRWLCVPCDAVTGISQVTYGPFDQIAVVLRLRNGGVRSLGTGAICETPEAVVEGLQKLIGRGK